MISLFRFDPLDRHGSDTRSPVSMEHSNRDRLTTAFPSFHRQVSRGDRTPGKNMTAEIQSGQRSCIGDATDLVFLDNHPIYYLYEIITHYLQPHLLFTSIDQAPQWTEYLSYLPVPTWLRWCAKTTPIFRTVFRSRPCPRPCKSTSRRLSI